MLVWTLYALAYHAAHRQALLCEDGLRAGKWWNMLALTQYALPGRPWACGIDLNDASSSRPDS